MSEKRDTTYYRIGDYARFMGVSTDLLKHYEKFGLIHSRTEENGYRYYSFQQSVPLLECMRLHSYGLSLRETYQVLCQTSYEDVKTTLDTKIDDMERQVRFQQMVIDEHRRISAWMDRMKEQRTCVVIQEAEPMLFLPQSRQRDFIRDERIGALLGAWVEAMPMVKSCRLTPDPAVGQPPSWGLAVTRSHQEALGLPVNDVVHHIPGGRYLYVHFHHRLDKAGEKKYAMEEIRDILREYDLKPGGDMLQVSLMNMGMGQERVACGWCCAPLRDEAAEK